MEGVTIDRVTKADAAEVLELLVTVFGDTSRDWFEAGKTDPPYPESLVFVARGSGRIVSHVELLDMPVRYGEVLFSVGGQRGWGAGEAGGGLPPFIHVGAISGVATLPEWRRRGLATALMERVIAEMAGKRVKE